MIHKILGSLILVFCFIFVYLFETAFHFSGVWRIFHVPALILTGLGPVGLMLLCSETFQLKKLFYFLRFGPEKEDKLRRVQFESLVEISKRFYRYGAQTFDGLEKENYPSFIKKIFERLSMRISVEDVSDMVEVEQNQELEGIGQAIHVLGLGVKFSPSLGMLGTILGMTQLLSNLNDPAQLGPNMSLALLTTFFGLFFSLLVWSPLQKRLEHLRAVRAHSYEETLIWLKLMSNRKPVFYMEEIKNRHDHNLVPVAEQ